MQANEMQKLIDKMFDLTKNKETIPQLYIPVEQFAKEKASQTLGNAAFHGYEKHGIKSPIMSIENPPYGMAISTAEDLKDLVEMTRQRFVENATKNGKMSESEAKNAAEKLIGATWDTSHISMIRKQGFDKDKLVQQAEVIAPYVKHIHLNDNLGTTHTDLPPGMGDLPMKEILEKIEAKNSKTAKIFEGGNFFQHFQTSPHPYVLEGVGSPMYSAMQQPYWNQAIGFQQGYFGGYGTILPDQHFSMYGGGFSQLPTELGGQVTGRSSRFAGTPNA